MPVSFGCSLPSRGEMASPDNLRRLAQRAEDLSFDHVWVSDHIVIPHEVDSFYPYAAMAWLRSNETIPTSNRWPR